MRVCDVDQICPVGRQVHLRNRLANYDTQSRAVEGDTGMEIGNKYRRAAQGRDSTTGVRAGTMRAMSTYTKIECPACGQHVEFQTETLGQSIECPSCKHGFTAKMPYQPSRLERVRTRTSYRAGRVAAILVGVAGGLASIVALVVTLDGGFKHHSFGDDTFEPQWMSVFLSVGGGLTSFLASHLVLALFDIADATIERDK